MHPYFSERGLNGKNVGTIWHQGTARGHVYYTFQTHRTLSAGNHHPNGKLTWSEYKKGSFSGGRNTIKLVTFKDKIVIPQLLQKYVVKWYNTYILNPGLDRTEAMISNICAGQKLEE